MSHLTLDQMLVEQRVAVNELVEKQNFVSSLIRAEFPHGNNGNTLTQCIAALSMSLQPRDYSTISWTEIEALQSFQEEWIPLEVVTGKYSDMERQLLTVPSNDQLVLMQAGAQNVPIDRTDARSRSNFGN